MTREWQPGDVAMVTGRWIRTEEGHAERYAVKRPGGWVSRASVRIADFEVSEIRPLVVIDPARLTWDGRIPTTEEFTAWAESLPAGEFATGVLIVADALREFADPKPPCGASLTLGKDGALYRCSEPTDHAGPHIDGSCTWTAAS